MRSSQAAFDLIVAQEVTSKAVYSKKYRKPEWPGASSGATVGIGYDLGQTPRATIQADWAGRVPAEMLKAMLAAQGITGPAAKPIALRMRAVVDIPWETASAVHEECVIPRWEARLAAALPNTDQLSPDCFGVLLSLIFNRGTSFNMKGARYMEMRAIKAHMAAGDFDHIPAELRAMKRLWPTLAGLRTRRDAEAALFAKGLKAIAATPQGIMGDTGRPPRTDDVPDEADASDASELPDTPTAASIEAEAPPVDHGDPTILSVQKRLRELGYFEIGEPDGGTGGMARTQGAILAFRNDNNLGLSPEIDDDLLAALAKASPRKVSEARATATVEDLRDKGSTTITLTDRIKKAAGWLLGTAGVGAVGSGGDVIDNVTNGATKLGGFKHALNYMGIGIGAVVLLIVAGLVIWYFANRAQNNRVIEYQKGKNT